MARSSPLPSQVTALKNSSASGVDHPCSQMIHGAPRSNRQSPQPFARVASATSSLAPRTRSSTLMCSFREWPSRIPVPATTAGRPLAFRMLASVPPPLSVVLGAMPRDRIALLSSRTASSSGPRR